MMLTQIFLNMVSSTFHELLAIHKKIIFARSRGNRHNW